MNQSRGRHAAIPEWAFRHPVMLKPSNNLVVYTGICLLANYRNRTGKSNWEQISKVTGLSRSVIYRSLGALKDAGIITLREDGMYDLPMDNPCGKESQSRDSASKQSQSRDSKSQSRDSSVPIPGSAPSSTEVDSEFFPEFPPLAEKVTDTDPVKKTAHTLTVLAMEQPVKPVLRGTDQNPFGAVMAIIERLLRAGTPAEAIERAVYHGVEVWTVAGIQTTIAQAKPQRPSKGQDGSVVWRRAERGSRGA